MWGTITKETAMNLNKNLILTVAASLTLVACAECPMSGDYDKVPYNDTRTAGMGIAEYNANCPVVAETPAPAVAESAPAPAPAPVAPAPEPKVFSEQQTK
jgi:hypothetical protein